MTFDQLINKMKFCLIYHECTWNFQSKISSVIHPTAASSLYIGNVNMQLHFRSYYTSVS